MARYVGPQASADGLSQFQSDRVTRDGGQVVSQLHGKFYESASRARAYFGSSASGGIALLLPATGGGHPTLWNPSDSGRNLSVVRLELSWVSGANAPGAVEWAVTRNTGAAAGTGLPIATATRVTPDPCLVGGGADPKGIWSPTTNTFTVAPAFIRAAGISLFTGIGATAVAPFVLRADYDGDLVLAPGIALSLCFQTTTTTALFQVSVAWEEIDV